MKVILPIIEDLAGKTTPMIAESTSASTAPIAEVMESLAPRPTPLVPAEETVKRILAPEQTTKTSRPAQAIASKVVANTPKFLRPLLSAVVVDPTLRAYSEFINNVTSPILKVRPDEKAIFLAHMLAIIQSESRGVPSLTHFETNDKGNKVVGAYGLFQLRGRTWRDVRDRVTTNSGLAKFLRNTGLIDYLSREFKVPSIDLLAPSNSLRHPKAMPVYQLVPMIAFTLESHNQLRKYWYFDADGWHPRTAKGAASQRWQEMKKLAGNDLKDYHTGAQAIYTMMHTNGWNFLNVDDKLSYPERIAMDIKNFNAIVHDPGFQSALGQLATAPLYVKTMITNLLGVGDIAMPDVDFDDLTTGITSVVYRTPTCDSLHVKARLAAFVAPSSVKVVHYEPLPIQGSFRMILLLPTGYYLDIEFSKQWHLQMDVPTVQPPTFLADGSVIAALIDSGNPEGALNITLRNELKQSVSYVSGVKFDQAGLNLNDMFYLLT